MTYSIGTDIGGTFTDCVLVDEHGTLTTGKAPSTPGNFSKGFFDSIEDAAGKLGLSLEELFRDARILVHATTAATNAMVERKGSRVGLITTVGHGDVLPIMRSGGRTKGLDVAEMLFLPGTYKPEPLVASGLIAEVAERIDAKGDVVVPLDENGVRRAAEELLAAGAETFAICFFWGFLNPAHELRAREIVREVAGDAFISCSHEVAPQIGEYYRFVATVLNSYIGPLMSSYVGSIVDGADARGSAVAPLFAQCIGGMVPVDEVKRRPLYTLDSGPVSGLVASNFLGRQLGFANIITADMGGTTFDVSVIAENDPRRRETTIINQYELYLPMLDVESIGAGGGSIAWLDESSGTIKVGPQSAGADPGPVCYGAGGTQPTVTDANVVLGVVNPGRFLGGRRHLDAAAARAAIAALGARVGLSPEETAAGIVEIVDNTMADKIRRMTVFRGHDPRNFSVFAFGGAGPMHAAGFSRQLGVANVVVPIGNIASVLSAMGTISGDVVHIYDSVTRLVAPFDMGGVESVLARLEREGRMQLAAEGFTGDGVLIDRFVSMKYGAQVFDIEVPAEPGIASEVLVERFEQTYEQRYGVGSGYAPAGIEAIRLRVRASGLLPRPVLRRAAAATASSGPIASRPVWWSEAGGPIDTPVYDTIAPGLLVEGPAIVELEDTTFPVRLGSRVTSDDYGNLILTFQ